MTRRSLLMALVAKRPALDDTRALIVKAADRGVTPDDLPAVVQALCVVLAETLELR